MFQASKALTQAAVAFDHTVTTVLDQTFLFQASTAAFSEFVVLTNCGFAGTVLDQAVFSFVLGLWSMGATVFSEFVVLTDCGFAGAILGQAVFSFVLGLWSMGATVFSEFVVLTNCGFAGTVLGQAVFSFVLGLWSMGATVFGQGVQHLANGCMAGLSLWSSLFTGWQRVGIGSQDGKCEAKQ